MRGLRCVALASDRSLNSSCAHVIDHVVHQFRGGGHFFWYHLLESSHSGLLDARNPHHSACIHGQALTIEIKLLVLWNKVNVSLPVTCVVPTPLGR